MRSFENKKIDFRLDFRENSRERDRKYFEIKEQLILKRNFRERKRR